MKIRRIFLLAIGIIIIFILILAWIGYTKGGPVPYPKNLGSFWTIESSRIDPTKLLEEIKSGQEPVLQIEKGYPADRTFIMSIGWAQSDYIDIARAYHVAIWKDNPDEWHLYRAWFHTSCENVSGKFESADLYYYQEIKVGMSRKYSVRVISIEPQFGYIAWGGDTTYPRPFGGWKQINLESFKNISAEKALSLAEQQGGVRIRAEVNNVCHINVSMWPMGYKRSDWSVYYGGNTNIRNGEIWVALK